MAELHEESYKQGYVDGVKSKVAEELTDVIGAVVKGMHEAIVKSSERIMESVSVEKIAVQPVKSGEWLEIEEYGGWSNSEYQCSECGRRELKPSKFCPNCGVKLKED